MSNINDPSGNKFTFGCILPWLIAIIGFILTKYGGNAVFVTGSILIIPISGLYFYSTKDKRAFGVGLLISSIPLLIILWFVWQASSIH